MLHAVEHRGEELEGLALELVAIVLLRIAAQVDALAQVVHRRQVLAPVLVERAQHDVALDLPQQRRAEALDLRRVLRVHRIERARAEVVISSSSGSAAIQAFGSIVVLKSRRSVSASASRSQSAGAACRGTNWSISAVTASSRIPATAFARSFIPRISVRCW